MNSTADGDEHVIEGEFVEAEAADGGAGRRRGALRWLPWLLVLLLAAFIAGLFLGPRVEGIFRDLGLLAAPEALPSPANEALEAAIGEVRERLARLESRLTIVETGLSGVSAALGDLQDAAGDLGERLTRLESGAGGMDVNASAALAALRDRLAALEARLEALPAATSPVTAETTLAARIAALDERLAALEAHNAPAVPASPVVPALLALERAIAAGKPHAEPLAALEAALADLPPERRLAAREPIETLRHTAATGVASLAALRDTFFEVAAAVQRAAAPPPEAGWWARMRDRLSDLVVVRRKGAVAGNDLAARMARAEAALAGDNLAAALAEFEGLDAATRAPAEDWLAAAERRLEARRALDRLIALLGPAPAAGGAD
ncbi:MAG: COG4223 family protein [Rhodothalassiaceae bacterium]